MKKFCCFVFLLFVVFVSFSFLSLCYEKEKRGSKGLEVWFALQERNKAAGYSFHKEIIIGSIIENKAQLKTAQQPFSKRKTRKRTH